MGARRFLGGCAYALFLGGALAAGSAAGWIGKSKMMTALVRQSFAPKKPQETFGKSSMTLLLMGCDEDRYWAGYDKRGRKVAEPIKRNGSNISRKYARADLLLVARLDFEKGTITGVSIPRDTDVELPGYRRQKINAYNVTATEDDGTRRGRVLSISEQEGPEWMKRAVEHALPGVTIDRTVVMNYDAFKEMVDIVGGVTLDVPKKMDYDDHAGDVHIHLKPGKQKLDGYDSMMFVRFRKGNRGVGSDDDYQRQERQKQFIAAFKQAVIADWSKLPVVLEKATEVMNNALTVDEIASIALFARNLDAKKIQMGRIPTLEGNGTHLRVDEDKLPGTLAEFGLLPSVVEVTR